ncbi:MAG: hypothetical protein PHQ95_00645 [Candidatus Gracilibacteria bacterium]|nr:hypothetical protein [Candidatus Gracilibacteria bacterium]
MNISDFPDLTGRARKKYHDREKVSFVIGYTKTTIMKRFKLKDFDVSFSDIVLKKISQTSHDVEGLLLKYNKPLQSELIAISQQVIGEIVHTEENIADGTVNTKSIHTIKPTISNPPHITKLIEKTTI